MRGAIGVEMNEVVFEPDAELTHKASRIEGKIEEIQKALRLPQQPCETLTNEASSLDRLFCRMDYIVRVLEEISREVSRIGAGD